MTQTKPIQFLEDCRSSLQAVRGSLISLYASIGADHGQPVEVAKMVGFHKNMAWKLSRVITATDPYMALQHLPGDSGIESALEAFAKKGAPEDAVDLVRTAMRRFDDMVTRHAGDRAHLELILDGMGLLGKETQLETSREMMFRGASGLWGVQAKARLMSCFVAPSHRDPTKHTALLVGAMIGLRRLRPTATWRLFRYQFHTDNGRPIVATSPESILEPWGPEDAPYILKRFCSPNMPQLEASFNGDKIEYFLPAGPVGNLGASDIYFGRVIDIPAYATPEDSEGSFASSVALPVETLIFDMIVHRSMDEAMEPDVSVFTFPQGGPDDPSAQREQNRLPINERFSELAGMPPVVATPMVPRYTEILQLGAARLGYAPQDFRGIRLTMRHPPMSSMVVARWKLRDDPRG